MFCSNQYSFVHHFPDIIFFGEGTVVAWKRLLRGLSSFGFGGTNAHVPLLAIRPPATEPVLLGINLIFFLLGSIVVNIIYMGMNIWLALILMFTRRSGCFDPSSILLVETYIYIHTYIHHHVCRLNPLSQIHFTTTEALLRLNAAPLRLSLRTGVPDIYYLGGVSGMPIWIGNIII